MIARDIAQWPLNGRRRLTYIATLLLVVLFYGVGDWQTPERPSGTNAGWKAWWDQGSYYRSVAALEQNNFAPSEHHYPVGYALIGTLFDGLTPEQPFLIPDLACYAVIALAFAAICMQMVCPEEALALCFLALIWPVMVRTNLIRPWTNTPVSAALLILSLLAIKGRRDRTEGLITGVCASLIFAIRPGDLLFSWPVMTALWFGCRDWREALRRGRWFSSGALPFFVITLYYSLAIHGALVSTAYKQAAGFVGFGFSSIGLKLYTLLIDGSQIFSESRTLITVFPIILLMLPGMAVFLKEFRWRAGVIVATQLAAAIYFLAFNDFWVVNLFKYGALRYWLWMVPFWALYAYLSFRLAWRRLNRITASALLVLPILAWTLPQMTVRPAASKLAGDSQSRALTCVAGRNSSCSMSISLAEPVEFDVIELKGVPSITLTWSRVFIKGHTLQMFRDFYISDAADGTTYLFFYQRQRASCIRLFVPPIAAKQQQFTVSNFELALRHDGIALRNPFRRFHPIQ